MYVLLLTVPLEWDGEAFCKVSKQKARLERIGKEFEELRSWVKQMGSATLEGFLKKHEARSPLLSSPLQPKIDLIITICHGKGNKPPVYSHSARMTHLTQVIFSKVAVITH